MKCRSCGVKEVNIFGVPTNIVDGLCKSCREILKYVLEKEQA